MNICPDCEKEVEADSRFCPHCGVIFFTISAQSPDDHESEPSETNSSAAKITGSSTSGDLQASRKKCPECGNKVEPGALACKVCGLIFYSKPAKPIYDYPRPPVAAKPKSWHPIAFVLIATILGLTIYYFPQIRWVFSGNVNLEPRTVHPVMSDRSQFDLEIPLQGHPSGLTCSQQECIAGHPDTGTFIRVSPAGEQYVIRQQRVGAMSPLAWNGTEYISFQESGFLESFKRHTIMTQDGDTLSTGDHQYSAPESIGGIAWDGNGYWAASRKQSESDRGFIYRLDSEFKVVNKLVAPGSSCAGLTWDGSHLWFLDDRERTIYVLDVKGIQARPIGSYEIPLETASGIAFDGRRIWIADRDKKLLLRIDSQLSARWTPQAPEPGAVRTALQKGPSNFDEYRMRATAPEPDVYVASFAATIDDNVVYVSWDIQFGPRLLQASNVRGSKPFFGKLTVAVDGGNLTSPVARVYDASEGRSYADRISVLSGLGPGSYRVRLLIYLEYTDSDGRERILSKTIPSLNVMN